MYYIVPNLLNQFSKFSIVPFYSLMKFVDNYKCLKNLKLKLLKIHKNINKVRFKLDSSNYKTEYANYEILLKLSISDYGYCIITQLCLSKNQKMLKLIINFINDTKNNLTCIRNYWLRLSGNPYAIKFLKKEIKLSFIQKRKCNVKIYILFTNKNAIDLIKFYINNKFNASDISYLFGNSNAIPEIKKYFEYVNWRDLSSNECAIELIKNELDNSIVELRNYKIQLDLLLNNKGLFIVNKLLYKTDLLKLTNIFYI